MIDDERAFDDLTSILQQKEGRRQEARRSSVMSEEQMSEYNVGKLLLLLLLIGFMHRLYEEYVGSSMLQRLKKIDRWGGSIILMMMITMMWLW